jgi:hypothetical protein
MSTVQTHWQWPALAATLPAVAGFALLEKVANTDRVRFPAEEEAWINARLLDGTHLPEDGGRAPNEMRWRRAWRLVQLIDHADLYIASTRRASWIDANVTIEGAWPAAGPILAVTCHWGAGLWALRHLARSGHPAHFLARALEDDAPGADAWHRRYGRLRIRATERASHAPVIYTGGATDRIAAAWNRGGSIVALCDVPLPPGRSKIEVPFRGRTLLMPRGLVALACARGIPVVTFAAGPDRATGRRWLGIAPARVYTDPLELATDLAQHLERLIERDTAAWHMWPYAAQLLAT